MFMPYDSLKIMSTVIAEIYKKTS